MELTQEKLKEMFVEAGHITEADFERAVQAAEKSKEPLEMHIVALGLVSDYNLGKTIADTFEYPFCDLSKTTLEEHYFKIIPEVVARAQQAIVYGDDNETLYVATVHPDNYVFKKLLEKKTGQQVVFAYTTHGFLTEAFDQYKGDYVDRINALIEKAKSESAEGMVVDLVNLILEFGHQSRASDIHIEPLEDEIRIRFRIDGVLHQVVTYPKSLHDQVSFRIKILARLQTDEHGKTQDGRFSFAHTSESFDIRVSIIPITDGENIVMRILSSHVRQYSLNTLGFSSEQFKKVESALRQPHGLILSVGPTGSGKTTVLYSMLEVLNRPEVNIMTIEDPVEYDVESVQQMQVNPSKGVVFSSGLRSIVRQDPDIIMVGEIRDEETADIAINAALTGHLLLSTLHTNDAATTFPRLSEMGTEPFLVASSARLIISLRLVRTICKHCKESYFLSTKEQERIQGLPSVTAYIDELTGKADLSQIRFYRGAGCKVCHQSGFVGRSAVFEVLEVDDEIRLLISKEATADEINAAAQKAGMKTLLYDGVRKALEGTTTVMEVINVAYTT